MTNIEQFTKSGKAKPELNEDNIYVCEEFGFVIDGATGYGSVKITDAETDAKWYSSTWKEYLIKNLGNTNKSIYEIMREGLEDIISKLNEFENYKYAEFPPSAAVAIFRINEDKVEYYALADCSLLFAMKSGEIKIVSTNDIREIDERNMQLIVNTAKERNISTLEAKALRHIREVFVEMFKNRNTPTGGWVLSNNFESLLHANTGELRLSEIKSILGFSDGFSQIYELFKHLSPEQLVDRVHGGEKLEALYEELYRLQQQDENCSNYPRTKLRDDASAIKLIIAK